MSADLRQRLDDLHAQKESAEATVQSEGAPLPDLMAEADERAACALVGDADLEDVEKAEAG